MKKYHVQNYVRWKHDLSASLKRLPNLPYHELSRDQLIKKYGTKWKRFHSTLDYVWIGCVSIGILIDLENWKLYATVLLVFWSIVGIFVYLPLWWRKYNHEI